MLAEKKTLVTLACKEVSSSVDFSSRITLEGRGLVWEGLVVCCLAGLGLAEGGLAEGGRAELAGMVVLGVALLDIENGGNLLGTLFSKISTRYWP